MSDAQSPEELLQSALSSAFTPVSIAPAPPESGSSTALNSAPAPTSHDQPPAEPLVSQEELARHEEERAALERSWKEASARQRQEAEERRARIAAEHGGESWNAVSEGQGEIRGPPNPLFQQEKIRGYPGSPSPADVRDVVSGEPTGAGSRRTEASAQVSPGTNATLEHSQRWEEIESLESSYPSLSFPEQSDSAPSSDHGPIHSHSKSRSRDKASPGTKADSTAGAGSTTSIPSATLSIFDSSLPPRARLVAFLSSLSINLLLPFINGVMLGFGEIFARNMASRFFGWGVPAADPTDSSSKERSRSGRPGGSATAVGVGAADGAAPLRRN